MASTTPPTPSGPPPFSHTAIDRTARLEEVQDAFSTAALIQERYNTGRPPSTRLSEDSEMEVAHLAYRQPTVEDTGLWRVSVKVRQNTPITLLGHEIYRHFVGWRGIQCTCISTYQRRSASRRHLGRFYSTITTEFDLYRGTFSFGDTAPSWLVLKLNILAQRRAFGAPSGACPTPFNALRQTG